MLTSSETLVYLAIQLGCRSYEDIQQFLENNFHEKKIETIRVICHNLKKKNFIDKDVSSKDTRKSLFYDNN